MMTPQGSLLVDCESATIQRLGPPAVDVEHLYWSESVQVLRLRRENGPPYCALRTRETGAFEELPGCYAPSRADGSVVLQKMTEELEVNTRRPTPAAAHAKPAKKPAPPECMLVLDRDGKKLPCTTPEGPPPPFKPTERNQPAELTRARPYANGIVAPGPVRGLFRLTTGLALSPENQLGDDALGTCYPLLVGEAVFSCLGDPDADRVVGIAPDGTLKDELTRRRANASDGGSTTRFFETADGGLAVGGGCSGELGEVACVRDARGGWHDVRFSPALTRALERTAPLTRLIPTPDGRLYVGTGTLATGTFGVGPSSVEVLLFDAQAGEPTRIRQVPFWVLGAFQGLMRGPFSLLSEPIDVSFDDPSHLVVWPLERRHPAFDTAEHCRLRVALDGSFETDCTQGRLFALGRVGLLQQRDEFTETLDAGRTWRRVALPPGLHTDAVACTPLGCRIGPYFRAGWGEPG